MRYTSLIFVLSYLLLSHGFRHLNIHIGTPTLAITQDINGQILPISKFNKYAYKGMYSISNFYQCKLSKNIYFDLLNECPLCDSCKWVILNNRIDIYEKIKNNTHHLDLSNKSSYMYDNFILNLNLEKEKN